MTEVEILYQRLHNQAITRSNFTKPEDVVRWMGAVQAQDYLNSLWAIGLRTKNAAEADVEKAIAGRTILRTWPMRGTVHFVPAEDAAWMVKLLSPPVISKSRANRRKAGLDEAILTKSKKILAKALQGKQLKRIEVYDTLERAGIKANCKTPVGSRGLHIIGHLALEGLICFGPRKGKQPTFVLLEEWVQKPRELERDEGLAELAIRYFRSHGPATDYDFAWWSGLTLKDARSAIDIVRPSLENESVDGKTYWFTDWASTKPTSEVYLLPCFDEYTVAYKDRSSLTDLKAIGILGPVIVKSGRVVGSWKRTIEKKRVVLETSQANDRKAIAAAERYGKFTGLPVELVSTPSPRLSRLM